jgi:chromosome segregation protein
MKLKSISISGFKTFADRTAIEFHDGITGVIGPNGTGKSNVINSVRWVLGEQTAKALRDPVEVIFAGSQNRKPLSMAEVTLTFTNDGHGCPPEFMHLPEVSIGRRIYRDGSRECFMNKEPCRLRDIVDFLLAIGISSRGYSIIEQEKRDRIINASPEVMRDILEETAGITIFKQHRADAEKRLGSTNEKLQSLAEVENELKSQAENLKDQVEKVNIKRKLVNDLRDKEIRLLCHRAGTFRSLAAKTQDEINVMLAEVQNGVVSSAEWDARANDLKTEQIELQALIEKINNDLSEKKLTLAKYRERCDNERKNAEERNTRKAVLTRTLQDEQTNLSAQQERMNRCMTELEALESELKGADGLISTLEDSFAEAEENLRVDKNRGEELRSEIRAAQDARSTLRSRNDLILEQISRINQSLKRSEEQSLEYETQRRQHTADRDVLAKQLGELSAGIDEVVQQKQLIDDELKVVAGREEECRSHLDGAKQELLTVTSSLQSLQKLQAANEGLSDGAKSLRTNLASFVQGFLFENVSVDPKDEEVLERAMPDLLESALVQDPETLIDVLDKMEEQDLTRVGFLVKDLIAPLSPVELEARTRLLGINGLRNVGERLRSTQRPELSHLMGRIFIARDEWLLFKAQREAHAAGAGSFVFLSERGAVLATGREISFGKRGEGEATGLLQRRREIEELEGRKGECQRQVAELAGTQFEATEKRKELDAKLAQIDGHIAQERIEVVRLTSTIETFNLKIKQAEESLARIQAQNTDFQNEITKSQESFANQQQQIEKLERDLRDFQTQLEEFEENQSALKDTRDEIMSQLQSARSERLVKAERGKNSRSNYEDMRFNFTRIQQSVDRTLTELSELGSRTEASGENVAAMEREIVEIEGQTKAFQKDLEDQLAAEANVSEELRVVDGKIKNERDKGSAKQNLIGEKRNELTRFQVILETAEKDAFDKFGLQPSDLPDTVADPTLKEEKLEREINTLRKELEALGLVNERALEDHATVEEKLLFLANQRDDIQRSIEDLSKAISEIEETTKVRFKEIYEKVNAEFQALYPILFPGGSASLKLTQPEDMLTTGVEINARLPGKSMQRMHLFSGGEKALTAISLIFALLKTHPAPFCFLDEIDAPLDEANVGRFNEVLQMLSSDFQFVVITHNRRTMEVLDRIYGISMQDPGVSKLVSVDLTDVPEHLRKKSGPSIPRAAATLAGQAQIANTAAAAPE